MTERLLGLSEGEPELKAARGGGKVECLRNELGLELAVEAVTCADVVDDHFS